MTKKTRYFLEGFSLWLLFVLFASLSPRTASAIGGFLGRTFGPLLAASRKARRNLASVFPDMSSAEQSRIIAGMWCNLGRVIAEYPHLKQIAQYRTEVVGGQHVLALIERAQPAVFIGGHLANWEVNCAALLTQFAHPIALTYRAPNNPITARMLERARTLGGRLQAFPKNRESARHLMRTLKDGGFLGILIDQKYNEGVEAPFFGRPAMTNPVFVQLCQKYHCPLVPVRGERLEGCRFRLTVYPPIPVFDENGAALPIEQVIASAQALLEEWISERPEQWLWLHRRWKD
ncbi:MAG: lipid A biosynthesis acyltransferase [Alphaproteobacteria bacterium]|nr:lipid A biosynthesis acyltransferase [Alphaproteobacteria bacterium]